jgi:hypothetical protein
MVMPHIGFGEIRIETLGRLTDEIHGVIANITQGAIHVRVSQFLNSKSVRVWFSENCHSDGQLLFCRADEKAYCAGILFPPDPQQRARSELRVPLTNESAVITQLEGQAHAKCDAQAVDISRSGLGLLVDQRFTVGGWIKVELSFAIVFGEVMYSKPFPDGKYRLGLRIETLLMRDGRTGLDAEVLSPLAL